MTRKPAKDSGPAQAIVLRREAEERLEAAESKRAGLHAETDARALLHELHVHQIELEMQNEELQHARAKTQEALDTYHDLFDFAPVGYFLWDRQGQIQEANLAGAALLGLERREMKRIRFGQFLATEDRDAFADFLEKVLTSVEKQTCEGKLERNGSLIWVLIEGIATQNHQGTQKLCRAAVIDITQQKRAEELSKANEALRAEMAARKQAEELAEQANRAKDHFLAVLSHELRTPLTPVVMGVAMLQDRQDLDPATRETLEMVRRNVEMEARLIDDLLDVARIARGTISLTRQPIELSTVLNRAVEVCQPDIEARRLKFGMDWGPSTSYWVEADAGRLQQVFWNLLKNAVKFTPDGGCIGVRCRPDNGHVLVEVSDSGIGIDLGSLSRIFNTFEQAERTTARQFGGLGLGLAISKAIVEMHEGTISAHSDGPGKGASFRVRLPLTAAVEVSEASLPTTPGRHAARPLRILMVEDHLVTARIMRMLLTEAGHTVETAGDIARGLELACQGSYDLLVSDLGLPDGSGHELMRQLRARGQKLPGIALSGYGQEDDIQRSFDAGFVAHLTKPATREALLETVAAATAGETALGVAEGAAGAAERASAKEAVFNVDAALKRCFGKPHFLKNMTDQYLAESPALVDRLREALSKRHATEVAAMARRLAKILTYLDATKAAVTAQEIERFGKSGDLSSAAEAIAELERQVAALQVAVSQWSAAGR